MCLMHYTQKIRITPTEPLFQIWPTTNIISWPNQRTQRYSYMDIYMLHSSRKASHNWEIEARQAIHISRAERFCKLCEREIEHKEYVASTHLTNTLDRNMSPSMWTPPPLRLPFHQLEIEARQAIYIPRTKRFCKLCQGENERVEHFVSRCPV